MIILAVIEGYRRSPIGQRIVYVNLTVPTIIVVKVAERLVWVSNLVAVGIIIGFKITKIAAGDFHHLLADPAAL